MTIDVFMRSNLALWVGIVLYLIFEIIAIPMVSVLTLQNRINSVVRGIVVFISLLLAVFTPLLIVTPLDDRYLHVPEMYFQLYMSSLFGGMLMLSFIVTLFVDLKMLHRLKDPQNKQHAQIKYFQSGSGIVFLLQALLILLGSFVMSMLFSFIDSIQFPDNLKILIVITTMGLFFLCLLLLIKSWRGVLIMIDRAGKPSPKDD